MSVKLMNGWVLVLVAVAAHGLVTSALAARGSGPLSEAEELPATASDGSGRQYRKVVNRLVAKRDVVREQERWAARTVRKAAALAKAKARTGARRKRVVRAVSELSFPPVIHAHDERVYRIVDFDGEQPVYSADDNDMAAISTAADRVRGSTDYPTVDGRGVMIGVWEFGGGNQVGHADWGNRVTYGETEDAGNSHVAHLIGTLIAAGTVERAHGMAPGATLKLWKALGEGLSSYRVEGIRDDTDEMLEFGASVPFEAGRVMVSNHSYGPAHGWEPYRGACLWYGSPLWTEDMTLSKYTEWARDIDASCFANPYYLPFLAAGNERGNLPPQPGDTFSYFGPDGEILRTAYRPGDHPPNDTDRDGGYDTLNASSTAKNAMIVGAVGDAVITIGDGDPRRSALLCAVAGFSSWGPTDDGRIKPDIVGNGVQLYSTSHRWIDTAGTSHGAYAPGRTRTDMYETKSGTSMASPNCCGGAALIIDHAENRFPGQAFLASTLKALIIHTATDMGNPGPDYIHGWGLMDTLRAVQHIDRHADYPANNHILEDTFMNGATDLRLTFVWNETEPIRITLCYADPPGEINLGGLDDRTPALVNDLDLRLIAPDGVVHYPFVLDPDLPASDATTGDNDVDNVEQIFVHAPSPGSYELQIVADGGLTDMDHQDFSLIMSGTSAVQPPPTPVSVRPGEGYEQDFTGGAILFTQPTLPGAALGWDYASDPGGRLRIVQGALRLDARVLFPSSTNIGNRATLHVDLAGRAAVSMRFRWRESNEETNPLAADGTGDGLSISTDGTTWFPVYAMSGTSTNWQVVEVDLDAVAAANGLTYTADTRLRFSQLDNASWPGDGIEIDDVGVWIRDAGSFGFPRVFPVVVDESAETVRIAIRRLWGREGDVSVGYTTSAGTAVPDFDYRAVAGILDFPDGTELREVVIPILDDASVDGARTLSVTLHTPVGGAALVDPTALAITIMDNDEAPTIQSDRSRFDCAVARGQTARQKTFHLRNGGGSELSFDVSVAASWVDVVPAKGTSAGEWVPVTLVFDTYGLPVGHYFTDIVVTAPSAGNSPLSLPVDLLVGFQRESVHIETARDWVAIPRSAGDARAALYPFELPVRGLRGRVARVTLHLDEIEAMAVGDLDILLLSPDGTAITAFSDVADGKGVKVSRESFVLNSGASMSLPDGEPVRGGVYRPTNLGDPDDSFPGLPPSVVLAMDFGEFSGESPNGPWGLYAVDDNLSANNGRLFGWGLTLETVDLVDGLAERFTATSPANPFDLDGTALLFTPEDSTSGYVSTRHPIDGFPSPQSGTPVTLGDDDSIEIKLAGGREVVFYGVRYASFWIGSNGFLTFGEGDASSDATLDHHIELPRVAAMMGDLSLAGGVVFWSQLYDRVFVTWKGVLHVPSNTRNFFQIELFFDGRVRIDLVDIRAAEGFVTGISRGDGDLAAFSQTNFEAQPTQSPRILDYGLNGAGSLYLRWLSVPGLAYAVQHSSNLTNWATQRTFKGSDGYFTEVGIEPETNRPYSYLRVAQ